MRFHVSTLIGLALFFPLSLVSCGEMELPTAPLEKEESAAPESSPSEGEATVPEVSPSGEDSPTSSDHTPPPSEAIIVATLPTPCSIWRDHVVVLTAPIDKTNTPEALITLISLCDWANLPSAHNEHAPTLAATIAQGYQEYDLTNWRIPTVAEAKALKAAYTPAQAPDQSLDHPSGQVLGVQDFESINALLRNLEASELHLSEGATNARYLCEEAQKTFSFAPNTTISTAGTKATTYRLRLVKTLRLKLKQ